MIWTLKPNTILVSKHAGWFKHPRFHRHNKLKSESKAILVSTFNFSTPYTNIQHHEMKSVMEEFANFCFNDGDKKSIGIIKHGVIWSNSQEKYRLFFIKRSLKLAINYLIENSHFTLGKMCFRQLIRIPMESDLAPFTENLFLYYNEKKWLL